mgnify:CR=1 FL=1
MPFVIPMVGANAARRTSTREFKLGTAQLDDTNQTWVYVQASEAVATGTCTVSGAFALTDAAGSYTADVAFASGEYGWVRKTTTPL